MAITQARMIALLEASTTILAYLEHVRAAIREATPYGEAAIGHKMLAIVDAIAPDYNHVRTIIQEQAHFSPAHVHRNNRETARKRRVRGVDTSLDAPFIATLVDVTGLTIYFNVAAFILKGTLL